jgi:hypothetical protein
MDANTGCGRLHFRRLPELQTDANHDPESEKIRLKAACFADGRIVHKWTIATKWPSSKYGRWLQNTP